MDWEKRIGFLTGSEFKVFYRFAKRLFRETVRVLDPILQQHASSATLKRGGAVPTNIMLACTLRYLAGGSYLDISHHHGVPPTHFNKIVDKVVAALLKVHGKDMLGTAKFADPAWCRETANTFGKKNSYN